MEKADFAIINWWWADDHGAILTAFALQQFIAECGYTSHLLKCWSNYSEEKRLQGISNQFSKKYMCISDEVYGKRQDLFEPNNNTAINNKYTAFITGSDQVFRAEWVPDSWFLTFVNGKGKLAVAASFGKDDFTCPDNNRYERLKKSVHSFDFLSVREDDGIELCKKYFNKEACCILDPVFLVDRALYHKLADTISKKDDNFIFCYIRDINDDIIKMINNVADKQGLHTVFCSTDMTIEEFLCYIKKSNMVITDSYHGLCFSLIFEKNYLCILNKLRGKSRFESLTRQLNLPKENFLEENDVSSIKNINGLNYIEINRILYEKSNSDRAVLHSALDNVYNKYKKEINK